MSDESRPTTTAEVPVIVVGAGPVGAVLALELAHHGVPCVVVERATTASRHPKMDYVNGRSMELLRRLGLADEIRARGVPQEQRANFLWTRTFAEPPVHVWDHPSVAEVMATLRATRDGSAPSEAYHRVPGSLLEDLVRQHAHAHPLIDLRTGWALVDLLDGPDGVTATVTDPDGETHRLDARYLVACDGANSRIRTLLGVGIDEFGPATQHCSVYFRSVDPALTQHGRAFVTIAARGLTLVSRDGRDTWTGSLLLGPDAPADLDPIPLMRERLGAGFAVDEVLSVARWEGSLGVAQTYRGASVFLAGDAAHRFYPTGGYGANTGLADSVDLGWKLAAVVRGWGGPTLLDSYELERRPVALFNAEMCANLMEVWRRFGRLAQMRTSRSHLAGFLREEAYQANNVGAHFGYRYTDSPVVVHEPGAEPDWQWGRVVPTTWPGARVPSVAFADGETILDRLGPAFTLVDLSSLGTGDVLAKEAAAGGVPITYLRLDDAALRACWERDLVLVRPDHHVAWRGDAAPDDWSAILARVCGR